MSTGIPITASNAADVARAVKAGVPADDGPSSVRRSVSIAQLAAALVKAQGELKNPPKDSVNPHFKSKYADLATVRDCVVPVFSKHGLSVVQLPCEMGDHPALTTLLMHTSGEWIESTVKLRPGKLDPQGVGSAQSYMRRYSLQALAVVVGDDDDDGHAASRPAQRQQQQPAQTQAPPTTPTVAGVFKTLASKSPGTADEFRKACEYTAQKLTVAAPGLDRDRRLNDILEAVTDAARLPDAWEWAKLSPQNVTDGYAALVGYVKGEMTAKAGAA